MEYSWCGWSAAIALEPKNKHYSFYIPGSDAIVQEANHAFELNIDMFNEIVGELVWWFGEYLERKWSKSNWQQYVDMIVRLSICPGLLVVECVIYMYFFLFSQPIMVTTWSPNSACMLIGNWIMSEIVVYIFQDCINKDQYISDNCILSNSNQSLSDNCILSNWDQSTSENSILSNWDQSISGNYILSNWNQSISGNYMLSNMDQSISENYILSN